MTLAEIMNLDGERVAGTGVEEAAAIQEKLIMTGKPWCAVSAWVVIDVTCVPDGGLARFTLPLALYAHHVQLGDDLRLKAGEPVPTSFATGYDQRGIFETVDRIYILLGKGFRKLVDLESVKAAQHLFDQRTLEA